MLADECIVERNAARWGLGCSLLLTARQDRWLYTAIPQCRPAQNMTSIFQLAANLQAMLTQQNYLETGGGLPGPLTMSCHLQHQGLMSLEREWMFFTFIPRRLRGKEQIFLRTKVGEGRGLGDIHSKKIKRKVIRACIYWPLALCWVSDFLLRIILLKAS